MNSQKQKQTEILCMREGCSNPFKYVLRGTNKAFCGICTAIFYFDASIGYSSASTAKEKADVTDLLQVLEQTLKVMKEDGELLKLQDIYQDYFSDLKRYEKKLRKLKERTSACIFLTNFDEGIKLFEEAFHTLTSVRISQMAVTRNNYKLSLELNERVTGQTAKVEYTDQAFISRVNIATERVGKYFREKYK